MLVQRNSDADELRLHQSVAEHRNHGGEGSGGYPMLAISGGLLTVGNWNTTVTMHGRIPATTTARPGDYSDTVIVRIDW